MKRFITVLMCCLVVFIACEKNLVSPAGNGSFSIHLLKDHSLTISDIQPKHINDLEIEENPWLSDGDIEFYDFSSHCIYLKQNISTYFEELEFSILNQPFVVVANNKRCYLGSFHSAASSLAPYQPYIEDLFVQFYPSDVLCIRPGWEPNVADTRDDPDVKQALMDLNKFHGGLAVSIENIRIITNNDTATIEYSYTLTNHDQDDLYVLDPDKMGSAQFHYFTNGIDFRNNENYFHSQYKTTIQPEPWDSWQPEWFCKIDAGQTINRTVTLKGYPHLPIGEYDCTFQFANPTHIEQAEREIDNTRIWLGQITSDVKVVRVE